MRTNLEGRKAGEREDAKTRKAARNRAHYLAHKAEYVARASRWKAANRDTVLAGKRDYYQRHKARHQAETKAWWRAHPERLRSKKARGVRRRITKLTDGYVRSLLRDDRHGRQRLGPPPPPELISAKRWHLKLKRLLKRNTQ